MLKTIKSIYIKSFGKLKNFSLDFDDGTNLVLKENGFGKTTISAFIKAMFYGFTYKVDGIDRDSKIYLPWDGGNASYGGCLNFVDELGKEYKIERYFTATQKGESVKLFDLSLGKELPTKNIGETYLGLSAKAYESCFYIPQKDVTLHQDETVVSKLTNMVNTADSDKAVLELDNFQKHLSNPQRKDAVIPNLEREKIALTSRLNVAKSAVLEIEGAKKSIDESEKKCRQLSLEIERLQTEIAQYEKVEQSHEFARTDELVYDISNVRAQLDGLSAYSCAQQDCQTVLSQPLFVTQQKHKLPLVFCGVGMGVLAVILAILQQVAIGVISAVLAIALVVSAFVYKSKIPNPKVKELLQKYFSVDANSDLEKLAKQLEENCKKYHDLDARLQGLLARQKIVANPLPREHAEQKNQAIELFEKLRQQYNLHLANVNLQKGKLTQLENHESVTLLQEQIDDVQTQIGQNKRLLNCALVAIEKLKEAKEILASSYLPKLAKSAGQILSKLTDGKYDTIATDKEFNLFLTENGMQKEIGRFSRGIQQQTLFAFRLALSNALYQKIPFVLIDDGFVDLDEEKFKNAIDYLKDLAKNTQVIYFTCHQRGKLLTK